MCIGKRARLVYTGGFGTRRTGTWRLSRPEMVRIWHCCGRLCRRDRAGVAWMRLWSTIWRTARPRTLGRLRLKARGEAHARGREILDLLLDFELRSFRFWHVIKILIASL